MAGVHINSRTHMLISHIAALSHRATGVCRSLYNRHALLNQHDTYLSDRGGGSAGWPRAGTPALPLFVATSAAHPCTSRGVCPPVTLPCQPARGCCRPRTALAPARHLVYSKERWLLTVWMQISCDQLIDQRIAKRTCGSFCAHDDRCTIASGATSAFSVTQVEAALVDTACTTVHRTLVASGRGGRVCTTAPQI